MWLYGPIGNVSIKNCTLLNNSATSDGVGAVELERSKGDVSIKNCTFQNNI